MLFTFFYRLFEIDSALIKYLKRRQSYYQQCASDAKSWALSDMLHGFLHLEKFLQSSGKNETHGFLLMEIFQDIIIRQSLISRWKINLQ